MIRKVIIPKFDANMEEATVTGWLKKEGDSVKKGDPIVELTTDKANFDFESPFSGLLRKIVAEKKSVCPVGYVIALIGDAADPLPDVSAANRLLLEKHRQAVGLAKKPAAGPAPARQVVRATPAARRLAKERGLDLADIQKKSQADIVTEEMVRSFRA